MQNAYHYTSCFAQAKEINNERLEIAKRLISIGKQWVSLGKKEEADALFRLGINHQYLGEYLDAVEYYEQCLTKAEEMNSQQAQVLQSFCLQGLGNIDEINRNFEDAKNRYRKSLTIAQNTRQEQQQANIQEALARIYYYEENLDRAWSCNEQSLAIKRRREDRIGIGNCIGLQGSISLARGNYDEALNYFNQSLLIMKQLGNKFGIASTLTNIGFTYCRSERIPTAEEPLSQAIELWEEIRRELGPSNPSKVSIFEQQVKTYQIQQSVLIAQNKTTKALEIAEQGRARALVEFLISRLSSSRTDELTTIDSPTINQIKQIAKAQNATLVEYSIIGGEFKVQDRLTIVDSELYIWVIKPTGRVTFCSVDLRPLLQANNTLEDLVRFTRKSIGVKSRDGYWDQESEPSDENSPNPEEFSQRLKQLYQILIQPITHLLPREDTAKVIFIPQGFLFLVPFPALKDDSDQYLIEKHTILTAPSIEVLDLTRQQQAQVNQAALQEVLVLGNPTMPKLQPPLRPLPGAEKEAKAIATLLQTEAITGSDGTKKVIVNRMLQAKIIHLATHALLDDVQGLGSAIALAPSDNDRGWLTAKEILDLDLNAELVVLSACDTGRGRLTGDGVIGLSRSFISAGVPSVIVSLWAIPDSETAGLMTEFYNKRQQNYDKAQALRQAMLMTMRQHSHPRQWAAFTLIGEAKQLEKYS